MVFDSLNMAYSVIVHLKVCFNLYHPAVLHLCYFLQLEIPETTAVRLNFNHIITVCSVEVTLFEAVLDCQKLKLSWVPPCLCIFQACGAHLYYATVAISI